MSGIYSVAAVCSHFLEEYGDALSAADTGGPDAVLLAFPPQLMDDMAGDPGPGGRQGVAQGDGPAARVELLQGDVQGLLAREGLGREGLVDLYLVHLAQRDTRDLQHRLGEGGVEIS